jgi:hypothetical protein
MKSWLVFLLCSKSNIDRSQQGVSASIIHNSAVGNYNPPPPPPQKGQKTKADSDTLEPIYLGFLQTICKNTEIFEIQAIQNKEAILLQI